MDDIAIDGNRLGGEIVRQKDDVHTTYGIYIYAMVTDV